MKYVEVDGLSIAYREEGNGPTVILAHCSSSSHKQWIQLIRKLSSNFRILAPDFIGYGDSDKWPEHMKYNPIVDVNIIIKLANMADGPVHIIGHSYGGTIALEAAKLIGNRIKSLLLIEPVAFYLLKLANKEKQWKHILEISKSIQESVKKHNFKKAASIYMQFWIGRLNWLFLNNKQKESIINTIDKVAHEFYGMEIFETRLHDYQKIVSHTKLLMGSDTKKATRDVVEILKNILPNNSFKKINGAGHMCPITHMHLVNKIIINFINSYSK